MLMRIPRAPLLNVAMLVIVAVLISPSLGFGDWYVSGKTLFFTDGVSSQPKVSLPEDGIWSITSPDGKYVVVRGLRNVVIIDTGQLGQMKVAYNLIGSTLPTVSFGRQIALCVQAKGEQVAWVVDPRLKKQTNTHISCGGVVWRDTETLSIIDRSGEEVFRYSMTSATTTEGSFSDVYLFQGKPVGLSVPGAGNEFTKFIEPKQKLNFVFVPNCISGHVLAFIGRDYADALLVKTGKLTRYSIEGKEIAGVASSCDQVYVREGGETHRLNLVTKATTTIRKE